MFTTPGDFGVVGRESTAPPPETPFWKRSGVIVAAALVAIVVIGGVVALVASGGGDDDAAPATDPAVSAPLDSRPDEEPEPDVDPEPELAPELDPEPEPDPEPDPEPEPDVAVANGSRDRPYRFGEQVPIVWSTFGDADGSVWNTVVGTPRDITADVVAENQFNDPPPEGVTFLGFDVEMTLIEAEVEPIAPGFNFGWEVLGGVTAAVYDTSTIETESFGCGVTPTPFGDFTEAFVGGTVAGLVCVPVPTVDVGDPATQIALDFSDGRVVFAADGLDGPAPLPVPAPEVTSVSGGASDGSRTAPHAHDTPVDVVFDAFGDADGSVWTTTVSAPRDITAAVAAENQFNEPPADGMLFVGVDVTMTLVSADVEPLSPAFGFSWEILGGATALAHNQFSSGIGCGVVPSALDDFDEVLVGGSLSGTVCIPVPAADLDDPGTAVAMYFGPGARVIFNS